jgi:8-oxo-dGTP pyrophosphatase MutT (NUDIX family)
MPHIHEKIDYAADVFIVNGDAVLLRMHEKYDLWLPPGGHVELDEDFVEAALREAKEETGLTVTLIGNAVPEVPANSPDIKIKEERELLVPRFINRHRVSDTHEHISFAYFGTSKNRNIDPAPGEKTDGFKWFTRAELENPNCGVIERVRFYATAALDAAEQEA